MRTNVYGSDTKQVELTDEQVKSLNADGADVTWYAREAVLAHDQVDKTWERFSLEVLQDFAKTLPGKPLLIGHRRDGIPEGVWVSGEVREAGGKNELHAVFAIPELPDNEPLRNRVKAGVARSVSIGFDAHDLISDDDGESVLTGKSRFWPGKRKDDGSRATATWIGPGETEEGSLVWLGAQPGAVVKQAENAPRYMKDAGEVGLVLDWPQLAVEAVSVAGARGSRGKSDEERAQAWLDICRCYRALDKHLPDWIPGEKFAWDQFHEDELTHWHYDQAVTEAANVVRTLDSRVAGSFRHLSEVGACLPADATKSLRSAKAQIESLLGEPEPATESGETADDQGANDAHKTLIAALLNETPTAKAPVDWLARVATGGETNGPDSRAGEGEGA